MSDPSSGPPETAAPTTSTRSHALAALGYVVLTVTVLWPAVVHFRTRPLADDVDAAMFSWAWWAMPRAIADGRNPFATDLVFHPVGADLALTTTAPLVNLLTWPVQATLGGAAQVNTVQLASMFLAGFATYLLCLRISRHAGASFVAGCAYALLPARFVHVDSHLNLVETAVIPLGLLAYLSFAEGPTRRRVALLGVAVGASFLVDPQLAILLGLAIVVVAIARRREVVATGRAHAIAAAVALLVSSPLLVPMAVSIASGGVGVADPTEASLVYSASPLSWVLPPLDQLLLGEVASASPITPTTEGAVYPGLALLALALLGRRLVRAEARRGWVALAIVGVVLSLGPYPFVSNTYVRVPLPFFLLRAIPGLHLLRAPGRFGLIGALGLYVLAATALAHLARRAGPRGWAVVAAVGVVSVVELLPGQLPSRPSEVPQPYEAIAADPDPGAVLEIPIKWSMTQEVVGFEGNDENFMFLVHAITHGKPVVSGAVSRFPDEDLERLLSIPVYRQILALDEQEGIDESASFGVDDLRALGIGFVAYHRDDPAPAVLRYLRTLDLPVLADDGTVLVWKVPG